MLRKIITINTERCNGCGACAAACHEGAIGMENGKAVLLRDDYCDGLGDCLPACPTGAITFIEREAAPYDEAAVKAKQKTKLDRLPCGCPGTQSKPIERSDSVCACSQLSQWPVQLKLVPVNAPYFDKADLLIAADCTAYAYGDFHNRFIKNRVTLIGCPKLDDGDYAEKLTAVIKNNGIKSVTVVRMEVPCCGGLSRAVITAVDKSEKALPLKIITISTDGRILSEEAI